MWRNKQVAKNVEGDMIQDSVVIKNTIYDELMKLLQSSNVKGAMEVLKMQEKVLGVVHPYYPYYSLGIKRIGEDLVPYSKPLTKEAFEKYPPSIKGKFNFSDKYKNFKNIKELLDYSYMTQTEIEINNVELMKMIGEEVDPYQGEFELLLSRTTDWKIKPKEFPEARPYKIVIEGSEINYDYILLRTTRIEDNKVFLSNKEQKIDTEFNFVFDLKNKKLTANIKLNQDKELRKNSLLKYLKFTKSALNKSKLSIISLEVDAILAEGILDNIDYKSPFGNIDSEITFVEFIILIEEHYNTTIEIPKNITEDDLENVYYLGQALKYRELKGTWKEGTFDFVIPEEANENIKNLEDKPFDLSFVAPAKVLVFKDEFPITKIVRIFKNAQMKDLDKVKKKVEILEAGDSIKITFVVKGDNQYIEKFVFDGEKCIKDK